MNYLILGKMNRYYIKQWDGKNRKKADKNKKYGFDRQLCNSTKQRCPRV